MIGKQRLGHTAWWMAAMLIFVLLIGFSDRGLLPHVAAEEESTPAQAEAEAESPGGESSEPATEVADSDEEGSDEEGSDRTDSDQKVSDQAPVEEEPAAAGSDDAEVKATERQATDDAGASAPAESDTAKPAESGEQEEEGGTQEQEVDPAEEEESTAEEDPQQKDDDAQEAPPEQKKRIIGATAEILEKQSGLLFRARVDTGAKSCSLHVEEMEIVNEEDGWKDNIGKVVKFKVTNGGKRAHWLDRRIDSYVIIKSSNGRERRYKVPLTLRWKGIEKKVLVTLTNRKGMDYPLLLGRNFLRGDFLVDVELNSTD